MTDVFFIFSMQFDRDKGLDMGRLSLNLLPGSNLDIKPEIWMATSSTENNQKAESFQVRGGMIPPQYRLKNVNNYMVDLNPIPMPQNKGVAGNFYKITPFQVITDKGTVRSDFGIHLDANVPGSLGCIVLNASRFAAFEAKMKVLRNNGITLVPLYVQYS